MTSPKLLLHGAGDFLAVLALAGSLYLAWTGLIAGELGNLAKQVHTLEEEQRRERDLDARQQTLFACTRGKDRLALEVAAGRLSLLEGAARFRDLCLENPNGTLEQLRRFHGGASEEECFCRAVINRVRRVLADDPTRAEEAARRLEVELEDLLEHVAPTLPL